MARYTLTKSFPDHLTALSWLERLDDRDISYEVENSEVWKRAPEESCELRVGFHNPRDYSRASSTS